MRDLFVNTKLVVLSIVSSIISYISLIVLGNLDILDRKQDFYIVILVFFMLFMIYEVFEKKHNYKQIIISAFFNTMCSVVLFLFDGSFINFLLIPLNSILIYGKDFFESIKMLNTKTSIVFSVLISYIPLFIDLIFLKLRHLKTNK